MTAVAADLNKSEQKISHSSVVSQGWATCMKAAQLWGRSGSGRRNENSRMSQWGHTAGGEGKTDDKEESWLGHAKSTAAVALARITHKQQSFLRLYSLPVFTASFFPHMIVRFVHREVYMCTFGMERFELILVSIWAEAILHNGFLVSGLFPLAMLKNKFHI